MTIAAAIASRTCSAPCPVTGGPFLTLGAGAVLVGWQMQQHHEATGPLDERADRGAIGPEDQVALPVAGDGAVGRLGGPLADHDLLADEALAASSGASARDAQRPAGPQAGDELSLQRAAALHVEGLVDRLMGDPHRLIIGKLDLQPVGDLLRDSTPSPTCGPGGAACCGPSMPWSRAQAPPSPPGRRT